MGGRGGKGRGYCRHLALAALLLITALQQAHLTHAAKARRKSRRIASSQLSSSRGGIRKNETAFASPAEAAAAVAPAAVIVAAGAEGNVSKVEMQRVHHRDGGRNASEVGEPASAAAEPTCLLRNGPYAIVYKLMVESKKVRLRARVCVCVCVRVCA